MIGPPPAEILASATARCQPVALSDWHNLLAVIWDFLSLSLFSLGGGNTLLSEYHSLAVEKYCWLSSRQFADLYAIAEAAPQWRRRRDRDPAPVHAGDGGGFPQLEPLARCRLARRL